jgi:hypothetical protein
VNELLQAALRYAAHGYRVVPLVERDKKPRIADWNARATTKPSQIETWWRKWPRANIGLMPPVGCVVVDVDPRNGGDATALCIGRATPTQRSGGGGSHFVVRVPEGVSLPRMEGIDYITSPQVGGNSSHGRACILTARNTNGSQGLSHGPSNPPSGTRPAQANRLRLSRCMRQTQCGRTCRRWRSHRRY